MYIDIHFIRVSGNSMSAYNTIYCNVLLYMAHSCLVLYMLTAVTCFLV